ncbi:MAG: peptidase M16 [Legionella sp. 40-6]|nr:MAG: peptidase M16 [Legionella sp. 40-6]
MNIFKHIMLVGILSFINHQAYTATFKTEKWQTANGVQVIFYAAPEVPMLDISLAFAAGSAYDGNLYGLSALTNHLLNQGSHGKDAGVIAEALAEHGAQFSAEVNRDMAILNLRTLVTTDALKQSINTFAEIINYPDFTQEALTRERNQLLIAIEQSKESPEEIADLDFFATLYKNHPYAHPVSGTSSTLKTITRSQIRNFYHTHYVGKNATLVLVGAISSDKAHQISNTLTKHLPSGTAAAKIMPATPLAQSAMKSTDFPSSQTMIRLGQVGIDHHNPDYFPLMVGNYILGGGSLVSRLAVEIREKRGLTYGVDSQFTPMHGEGPFLISLSTRTDQTDKALNIIKSILHDYVATGPNDQELAAAKSYLTGSFPLSLASNRSIATLLLRMNFYHLPDDYLDNYIKQINAVTKEEIQHAFHQQINPDKLLLVTVGQS